MTITLAARIRRSALQMVWSAKASHIGSALSIADIVAVLYGKIMLFDPLDPSNPNRDRFILSKGHACVSLYAALADCGFFPVSDLETYGADHSKLMNHVSHSVPGVEFSTGSLGHGLPYGVGKALSARIKKMSWRTFVLLGDGEMDEGSNWEALMFAAHHKLDSLVAIIDYNKIQSMDTVSNTLGLEPLAEKLNAFGCIVKEVDGHDHNQLIRAFSSHTENKPLVIVAHTVKGKGVSFMENKVEWHYKNPDDAQLALALTELGELNA